MFEKCRFCENCPQGNQRLAMTHCAIGPNLALYNFIFYWISTLLYAPIGCSTDWYKWSVFHLACSLEIRRRALLLLSTEQFWCWYTEHFYLCQKYVSYILHISGFFELHYFNYLIFLDRRVGGSLNLRVYPTDQIIKEGKMSGKKKPTNERACRKAWNTKNFV